VRVTVQELPRGPDRRRLARLDRTSRLRGRQRRDGVLARPAAEDVLDRGRWHTQDQLHDAIVFWIERTYNRRRRQRALDKLTPVEYELAFTTQAAVAA
jgi:hypothetical protein